MIFRCVLFLLLFWTAANADARLITEKKNGALWVKSATTEEAENLFKEYNFSDFSKINSRFPRIYFLRLPSDWKEVADSDDKHRTFIRIMLPLVLAANEKVIAERQKIEDVHKKFKNNTPLSAGEQELVEKLAEKYDAFTRLSGRERTSVLLQQLLSKIDAVPPSILIATAGIYSDWGTSRLALQANSLYLREIWYDNQGLKPLDDSDADYRYKMYGTLSEGIEDQILKLNSNINYRYLRISRDKARQIGRPLYGPQVAATMLLDSNLKNIAGMIDYTFSFYKLQKADYNPQLENIE